MTTLSLDVPGSSLLNVQLTRAAKPFVPTAPLINKAKSGVPGLDDILAGGFARGSLFLIEGNPGTGKTTIALRCLLEGTQAGEKALYITLSETEEELRSGAASHGWIIPAALEYSSCSLRKP